ncbi:uncharacterized protein LOC135467914 [Liolophura sinensis]|uniref:uncharacterized protein LOC135467914 n=1 Tax=Liolophura sinensis TaxID=3198878 RepID=UPI0031593584
MEMDVGLKNAESRLTGTESLEFAGIEAHDVGSLLEQFEEASQSSEDSSQPSATNTFTRIPERKAAVREAAPIHKVRATNYVSEKLKCGTKRKGAILLPMGVPCGRGSRQSAAIPVHCSSPKLQKILHKTSSLAEQQPPSDTAVKASSPPTSSSSDGEVSSSYYDDISDHDYCQNFPHSAAPPNTSEKKIENEVNPPRNVVLSSSVPDTSSQQVLQLHDPESSVFSVTFKKCSADNKGVLKEKFTNLKHKITHKEYKHRHRNYRKKEERVEFPEDSGQFFDKIPSYISNLSRPTKPPKKDQKNDKDQPSCGMKVTDFIQREISPSVHSHSEVYNKLPAYHNCFINSTKYDSSSASNSLSMVEAVKLENAKYPWDRLRDNLNRENPGSRSQSPLLMLESRYESKSREISRSRSSSRHSSRSRSACSTRSPSSHSSRSRSRSRGRSRRSRRRPRRRERGHSYSSYSSVSSDSDWSYCSRSRSCSRDRYYSRSYSRGSSRSHSRSPSRHRHKSRRNASYERRKEERQKLREEEKKRQIEERRIVYVGKIPDTFTRKQLRARFDRFGEIEETSVHFRENGDNYGFVTYAYTCDAYAAIENGNKIAGEQPFDLCFGGRREFCSTDYADLDGQAEEEEESFSMMRKPAVLDFDQLLNEARRKLKK